MAIRITFPDPADSPTGAAVVRVRWGMHRRDGRTVPVLTYRASRAAGGRLAELNQASWEIYRRAGAQIDADTDREHRIIFEALGLQPTDGHSES